MVAIISFLYPKGREDFYLIKGEVFCLRRPLIWNFERNSIIGFKIFLGRCLRRGGKDALEKVSLLRGEA